MKEGDVAGETMESIRLLRILNGPPAGVQKSRHLHDVHRLTDFSPMPNAVQFFCETLAHATEREIVRHVQYLKNENRVLRDRLPEHIVTTPAERARLLKYGRPVGPAINQLITIVVPGTFHRWVREAKGQKRKKEQERPTQEATRPQKADFKDRPRDGLGLYPGVGRDPQADPPQDLPADRGQHHAGSRARTRSQARRKDLGRVREDPCPHTVAGRLLHQARSDPQRLAVSVRAGVPERGHPQGVRHQGYRASE